MKLKIAAATALTIALTGGIYLNTPNLPATITSSAQTNTNDYTMINADVLVYESTAELLKKLVT